MRKLSLILVFVFQLGHEVLANENVGVLTQVQGQVELYANPAKAVQGEPPHISFEGEYYSVRRAKMGDKIGQGFVVKTGNNSKARVVYVNGDHFNLGANTSYKIQWDESKKSGATKLNLIYGKIRSVVSKDGPRTGLQIKTPTATAGVRGTDFFVDAAGPAEGTKLSVMRGEVAVKAAESKAPPTLVKTGYVVDVQAPVAPKKEDLSDNKKDVPPVEVPKIELRKTTQEELVAIQQVSQIKPTTMVAAVDPEVKQELQKLESQAVATTLKDIKAEDPKLYEQIKDKPPANVNEINTAAVANVLKEAPKAPDSTKPIDLKDLDENVYKKYFKPE